MESKAIQDLTCLPALRWASAKVYGVPDLLVHTTWLKDHFPDAWQELQSQAEPGREPDGYIVFELRFTSRDKDKQARDSSKVTEAQVRLNTYILGHLQGWMPKRGFLITRDHVTGPMSVAISSNLDRLLDDDLAEIRDQFAEIRTQGVKYRPWEHKSVASNPASDDERWHTAKGLTTWKKTPGGAPRAIYRIGAKQKRDLAERGYNSIDAMLRDIPSVTRLEELTCIGEVYGKEIRAILQANRTGTPVLPKPEAVPSRKTCYYRWSVTGRRQAERYNRARQQSFRRGGISRRERFQPLLQL